MDSRVGGGAGGETRGMARIDPEHPPLWRTPTVLQFGPDAVAVVDDPSPWQQRLVRELERGIPDAAAVPFAVAAGASQRAAERFLARIGPALAHDAAPGRAALQAAGDVLPHHLAAIEEAMVASGCAVDAAHPFDPPGGGSADASTLVIVAHRLIPPAFAAALMADDRPHLPVVLTPRSAQVGPLIRPGRTPCLSCLAAERRDADPAWPTVAAQLVGRAPIEVEPSVLWEAGVTASRMLREAETSAAATDARSLTLRAATNRRSERVHRPHPECRCRSLAGSERAPAPARLEPTTTTAYARPA